MNILFVISSLSNKAPVKVLFDIVNYVKRHNQNNVYIITFHEEGNTSISQKIIDLGIEVHCLRIKPSTIYIEFNKVEIRNRIKRFIVDNQIDLLHCSCYDSVIICSKIKGTIKSLTFHNYCTHDYKYSRGLIIGSYMSQRFLKASFRFDIPIAISQSMQNFYEKKLKKKVDYIYNGIDTSCYVNLESLEKQELREKLGLADHHKIFIVNGYLTTRKNPLFIISCFIKLNLSNVSLVFIGDGPLMETCIKMAKDHENIKFVGFVNNGCEYLKASDFAISSSFSEGMPLNVLEAISIGLPVLLSNIPPHIEIVKLLPEDSNIIFNQKDENSLKSAILKIVEQQDSKIASILHKIAIENFSKEKMASQYLKLFTKYNR